jgi:hypothetical protein
MMNDCPAKWNGRHRASISSGLRSSHSVHARISPCSGEALNVNQSSKINTEPWRRRGVR